MDTENGDTASEVRTAYYYAAVKTAGAKESRVQDIRSVGGCQSNDAFIGTETVHFYQELVQCLFPFIMSAAQSASALTAYGIHAYDFKLKKAAWGFILAVMMVPTQVFAIGYYKFMIQLKLIDTYWPLIIPAITTPVVVFFLRQYLLGALPLEVVEAARIDGSGEFHTFNTIVLPIMKPALAVQAIFQFVANWNSLFLPSLIINSTGKKTLTMFVQMLMGESFRADYGVIFLALSITILPMFIMYFLLSRYIVEGVSLGSVKG